jgi:hypothetical protein
LPEKFAKPNQKPLWIYFCGAATGIGSAIAIAANQKLIWAFFMSAKQQARAVARSRPRDLEHRLQFAGEFRDGLCDLVRLFRQRIQHPRGGFRPAAKDFDGRHDQRKVVVHVMAHAGELFVQFVNLLDVQGYGFAGQ